MRKQDYISIVTTFLIGLFVGGYLYLTGFASYDVKSEVPDVEEVSEFTIVGEVYGGCQLGDACPSFQVLADGSYRYFFTPAVGIDQVLRQGTIPVSLRRRLRVVLTKENLLQQSKKIQPSLCNSYSDGIDVKYEIELDGTKYVLDSCGTAVAGEGKLWTTLGDVWTYYENT